MAYVPHYRLTMSGTLPGNEIWSCNLSLKPVNSGDALPEPTAAGADWSAVVTACSAWFSRATTYIATATKMTSIKVARLDTLGHYDATPYTAAVNVAGGTAGNPLYPLQIAQVITLETLYDLRRVKGRIYVPTPMMAISGGTNAVQWANADASASAGSFKTFLAALQGISPSGTPLEPCVASKGRHNKDGSLRLAGNNYPIDTVSVGLVPDTQRRRRNKLQESRFRLAR